MKINCFNKECDFKKKLYPECNKTEKETNVSVS